MFRLSSIRRNLAEKIVATPIVYKATPLDVGFKMLLQQRTTEARILRRKIKALMNNEEKENLNSATREEQTQFIITSEKRLMVKKIQASFLEAACSDLVFPKFAWNFTVINFFECISVAVARGAKIRLLTEEGNLSPLLENRLQALAKSPFFQIRFARAPLDFGLAIFNNEEVNVSVANDSSGLPSMWTNNPHLLKMAQTTFETWWKQSLDYMNFQLRMVNSTPRTT